MTTAICASRSTLTARNRLPNPASSYLISTASPVLTSTLRSTRRCTRPGRERPGANVPRDAGAAVCGGAAGSVGPAGGIGRPGGRPGRALALRGGDRRAGAFVSRCDQRPRDRAHARRGPGDPRSPQPPDGARPLGRLRRDRTDRMAPLRRLRRARLSARGPAVVGADRVLLVGDDPLGGGRVRLGVGRPHQRPRPAPRDADPADHQGAARFELRVRPRVLAATRTLLVMISEAAAGGMTCGVLTGWIILTNGLM